MIANWTCETCFDTQTIDQGGREVACPDCGPATITIKLTALPHGLGSLGDYYERCTSYTNTTMVFEGTRGQILADVASVRGAYVGKARQMGYRGRNNISSGPIAIEKRVRAALEAQSS